MQLEPLLAHIDPEGEIPPVDQWHPAHHGDMDLTISADGGWVHEGTPIARPRLIRLLSTLLRRESNGEYVLVTPAERQRIQVEDCPFVVVDADRQGEQWWLTTNVGDRVCLDARHRLRLSETPAGDVIPEVPVRFGLAARLGRNVYYRLVEQAQAREAEDGSLELGLTSDGGWHPLGRLEASAQDDDVAPCR